MIRVRLMFPFPPPRYLTSSPRPLLPASATAAAPAAMSISRWRTPAVAPWSTPSPSARRRWGLRLCLQSIAPPPLPRTAGCSHAQCCSLMRPATTCKRRGWPLAPPSLYIPVHSNAEGEPFKIYRVPVLFLNDRFTFGFLLGTGSSPLLHFPQPSVESFPRHLVFHGSPIFRGPTQIPVPGKWK